MEQLDYLGNDFYRNIDESTFASIDNDFQSSTGNEIELFKPLDVDSQSFFNSLRKNGKVIVTDNVMSYKQQVISLQSKTERIEVIESNLQAANSQIKRLEKENRKLSQKQYRNRASTPEFRRSEIDALAAEKKEQKEELTLLKSKEKGDARPSQDSDNHNNGTNQTNGTNSSGQGSLLVKARKAISDWFQKPKWFQITTLILLLICIISVYVKKTSETELTIPTNVFTDSESKESGGTNTESFFTQMKETNDF